MTPPYTPLGAAVIDEHLARQRAREAECKARGGHPWELEIDDSQPIVTCPMCDAAADFGDTPIHMRAIPVTWQAKVETTQSNPITGPAEVVDEWIEVTPCG